jgi:multiple antibiotic resistance protein
MPHALWISLKIVPTIFLALFPVVNPIGTALILTGMTSGVDPKAWKTASRKIAVYSFLVLACFFLFGYFILKLFGITIPVVQVSGGVVLAFMGWQLLNGSDDARQPSGGDGPREADASIAGKTFYPFTFPLTVGPGGLAITMTFGAHVRGGTETGAAEHLAGLAGIFAICLAVYLCYSNLQYISARIAPAGVKAISKMLSFFVICIGVGILWEGIEALRG